MSITTPATDQILQPRNRPFAALYAGNTRAVIARGLLA
ncbi:MAG: ABC transporter, partial [Acidobacteria bacterium]|nr:ABC transporter [Acidobacteriota bacterium]